MNEWDALTEATIDSIHLESTNRVIRIDITCMWKGAERRQIVARGVDDFVLSDMRMSNIIDRVTQFDGSDGNSAETVAAARLFVMMRGREPTVGDLQWPELTEKLVQIRDGSLILIEIEPVYGASAIILAKSFQLELIK